MITQLARATSDDEDPEPFELDEQTGERMAELFVAQLLPDIERAEALVHRDQTASEAVEVFPTGGGESHSREIRARSSAARSASGRRACR